MTPEQWAPYGGCPTCEAAPSRPCTVRPFGFGDELDAPHPGRPLARTPDEMARLLDDVVTVSVKEGVTVHPGDTLVIRLAAEPVFPDDYDRLNGELEQLRAHVEARLPRGARVIVIAADAELAVIRAEPS